MKKQETTTPQKSKPVKLEKLYTLDELKEVFYFSLLHGATLWQYCQDTGKELPKAFEAGTHGLLSKVVTAHDLQELLKSRALLVGVFDELCGNPTVNTTPESTGQEANQLNTSL